MTAAYREPSQVQVDNSEHFLLFPARRRKCELTEQKNRWILLERPFYSILRTTKFWDDLKYRLSRYGRSSDGPLREQTWESRIPKRIPMHEYLCINLLSERNRIQNWMPYEQSSWGRKLYDQIRTRTYGALVLPTHLLVFSKLLNRILFKKIYRLF